jgi:hypothetical protein
MEIRELKIGLLERGGSCRSKHIVRTGKFKRPTPSGCLPSRATATRLQVMERNPSTQATTGPEQYSNGGYEVTFGTYQVDESAHRFAFSCRGRVSAQPDRQRLAALFRVLGQSTHCEVYSPGGTLESNLGALLSRALRTYGSPI